MHSLAVVGGGFDRVSSGVVNEGWCLVAGSQSRPGGRDIARGILGPGWVGEYRLEFVVLVDRGF